MTWFCVECFEEIDGPGQRCPSCGAPAEDDLRSYENKLVTALNHRLPDRQVLAARILGALRSQAAIPALAGLAEDGGDPYLAAEAARALAMIEPEHPVVRRLEADGPLLSRTAVRKVTGWR
jgi:HEAT repeat protein